MTQQLTLASKSAIRATLLRQAGLEVDLVGSGVDEESIKTSQLAKGASPEEIARVLARAKALAVSNGRTGLVIGADQTLELDGVLYDKAGSMAEARQRLKAFSGKRHHLHSAMVVSQGHQILYELVSTCSLTVRLLSEDFIDHYLHMAGEEILSSVGCYQLEGHGVQLFETIEGDYFSILGLPVLGLLSFLRTTGHVPT